jgi:hypothetical protein
METDLREHGYRSAIDAVSPASRVMREALDLAIEERSPFPERSLFLDDDVPLAVRLPQMERAAREGTSVVLVSPDLSTRVLVPDEVLGADAA